MSGERLVEHPDVRVISFTGSTAAGRRIGESAGRLLKRAHLELGGNNALVVLDDVDVDAAVSAGAWGSFLHQGQICMTTGRHVVPARVYDRYVERPGRGRGPAARRRPAHLGRAARPDHRRAPARSRARARHRVRRRRRAPRRGRHLRRPLLPADRARRRAGPTTRAFAEEVFGPVAPVLRFDGEDELVDIVNRSEYGLSLGILTKDVMRGPAPRGAAAVRHRAHQRPDRRRRVGRAVRRGRRIRAPACGSAASRRTRTPSPRPAGSPRRATSSATRSERRGSERLLRPAAARSR